MKDNLNTKGLFTIAGIASVIVISFYATGLYRNVLQIKKLREENTKPLKPEDL